ATLLHTRAVAQQEPMYTMYMWNMLSVNPGYAGSADVLNATVVSRRQWVGIAGAPTTSGLLVHTPLRARSIGIGGSVIDDRIGPTRSTQVAGDFAYRIRMNERTRLAFGLKLGMSSLRMDLPSVPDTDVNDPIYQVAQRSSLTPNFGFGVFYWNRMAYLGLSIPKLLNTELFTTTETGKVRVHRSIQHLLLMGGHVFRLSDDLHFRPSFSVKATLGAPLSGDLSANFLYLEKLWAGLAYRTSKDLSAILSYQLSQQLRAGYAYDMTFSGLQGKQGGSHEVMLTYDFAFTKRLLRSPRYF
ncbi:MAG TPA: type IX secretion system membrane protein PorP/SprF, partial [Flavobacteriales bacterium]